MKEGNLPWDIPSPVLEEFLPTDPLGFKKM
jgi:hypothetical protein